MTGKVYGSKEGLAGKKENSGGKKKKNIGMTEIKDSQRPRAEIKCGAGRGRFLTREPDFPVRAREASS